MDIKWHWWISSKRRIFLMEFSCHPVRPESKWNQLLTRVPIISYWVWISVEFSRDFLRKFGLFRAEIWSDGNLIDTELIPAKFSIQIWTVSCGNVIRLGSHRFELIPDELYAQIWMVSHQIDQRVAPTSNPLFQSSSWIWIEFDSIRDQKRFNFWSTFFIWFLMFIFDGFWRTNWLIPTRKTISNSHHRIKNWPVKIQANFFFLFPPVIQINFPLLFDWFNSSGGKNSGNN